MPFKTQHHPTTSPTPFYNNVIQLALAPSEAMRFWTLSRGQSEKNQSFAWFLLNQARVEKEALYRQNNTVPVRRGLVCPSIFGLPYTHGRRSQLGFIQLAFPMAQSWLLRDSSLSYYGVFTACSRLCLTRLIYNQAFIGHYDTTMHPTDDVHLSAQWTFTPWHVHVGRSESFDLGHGSGAIYHLKIAWHTDQINAHQTWMAGLNDAKWTFEALSPIERDQSGPRWNTFLPEDKKRTLPSGPPEAPEPFSGAHKARPLRSGSFFQRPFFAFEPCKLKPWNFVSTPHVFQCGHGFLPETDTWRPWDATEYLWHVEHANPFDLYRFEDVSFPPSTPRKRTLPFYVSFTWQDAARFFPNPTFIKNTRQNTRRVKKLHWRRWLFRWHGQPARPGKTRWPRKTPHRDTSSPKRLRAGGLRPHVPHYGQVYRLLSIQRAYERFPKHALHFLWNKHRFQKRNQKRRFRKGRKGSTLYRRVNLAQLSREGSAFLPLYGRNRSGLQALSLRTGLKNRWSSPFLTQMSVYRCSTMKALQAFKPYMPSKDTMHVDPSSMPLYLSMDPFARPPSREKPRLLSLPPEEKEEQSFQCLWERDFLAPKLHNQLNSDIDTPETQTLQHALTKSKTFALHAFQACPNKIFDAIPPDDFRWNVLPEDRHREFLENNQKLQFTSTRCNALPSNFPQYSFNVASETGFAPYRKTQRVQSYVWNKGCNAFFQSGVHFEHASVPKFETRLTAFMPTYVQPCKWMRTQSLFQTPCLKPRKTTFPATFYGANPVLKPFFQNQAYRQRQKQKLKRRVCSNRTWVTKFLGQGGHVFKRPYHAMKPDFQGKKQSVLKKRGLMTKWPLAGQPCFQNGHLLHTSQFGPVENPETPRFQSPFQRQTGGLCFGVFDFVARVKVSGIGRAFPSQTVNQDRKRAVWHPNVRRQLEASMKPFAMTYYGLLRRKTFDVAWLGPYVPDKGRLFALTFETLNAWFRGIFEVQRLRCKLKRQFQTFGGQTFGVHFQTWLQAKLAFETSFSVKQRSVFLHIPLCLRPGLWYGTSAKGARQKVPLSRAKRKVPRQQTLGVFTGCILEPVSIDLQSWVRACITPKLGGIRWYRNTVHVHVQRPPQSLHVKRINVRHGNDLHAFIHRQPHLVRNRHAVVHNNWVHVLRHRYESFRKFMLPHTLECADAWTQVPNFAMVNYIDRGMTNKMSHCGADALSNGLQHLDLQVAGQRAWKKLLDYQQAARYLFGIYKANLTSNPSALVHERAVEMDTLNRVSSKDVYVSDKSTVGPRWELSNSDSYSAPDDSALPILQRSVRRTWSRRRRPWLRKPYYSSNTWTQVYNGMHGQRSVVRQQRRIEKQRVKFIRRYKLLKRLAPANISWMVLRRLPVLPADCRPVFQLDNLIASTDLTTLYSNVLYYNEIPYQNRLKEYGLYKTYYLTQTAGMPVIQGNYLGATHLGKNHIAGLHLQGSVDALIDTSKQMDDQWIQSTGLVMDPNSHRLYKSLTDRLKGKTGRFRFNLLGKRVDYSARSVIVVGPTLHVHECGLPKPMAFKLFHFHVLRKLILWGCAKTRKQAQGLIQTQSLEADQALESVLLDVPVLLNRAPTLHRLGFQAFQPRLVRGRAILLHPLVCTGFNADFDGDQMGVHVPLSSLAKAEAQRLMISAGQILGPANSEPMLVPSQDMVLGCYVSSHFDLRRRCEMWKHNRLEGNYFSSFEKIHQAYELGRVDLHSPILLFVRNFESDLKQQTNEIQIQSSGQCTHIFKSVFASDITSIESRRGMILFTTVGRVCLNDDLMQTPF